MKNNLAALALSAALMTGAAEAASVSFNGASLNGEDFLIGWFDTALGTLTGVAIDLFATADSFERAVALDDAGTTATALASIKVAFAGLEFFDEDSVTASCTGAACLAEASVLAQIEFIGDVFPDFGLVSGVGSGVFLVDVTGVGRISRSASLAITYTYDEPVAPVPLPAAGGLMLAGLGGLALLRRRAGSAQKPGRS